MAFFTTSNQRTLAQAVWELAMANPFTPQRVEAEKRVLGDAFKPAGTLMDMGQDQERQSPNVVAIEQRVDGLVAALAKRIAGGQLPGAPGDGERAIYETVIFYWLYYRYHDQLHAALLDRGGRITCYDEFKADVDRMLAPLWGSRMQSKETPHVFACLYQVRRAFHHIFSHIIGRSSAIVQLRAAVWQSIFTHDIDRYRRVLFDRMGDYTTLVTGPSGTGKELVARAIAMARYEPFDVKNRCFSGESEEVFFPINL